MAATFKTVLGEEILSTTVVAAAEVPVEQVDILDTHDFGHNLGIEMEEGPFGGLGVEGGIQHNFPGGGKNVL